MIKVRKKVEMSDFIKAGALSKFVSVVNRNYEIWILENFCTHSGYPKAGITRCYDTVERSENGKAGNAKGCDAMHPHADASKNADPDPDPDPVPEKEKRALCGGIRGDRLSRAIKCWGEDEMFLRYPNLSTPIGLDVFYHELTAEQKAIVKEFIEKVLHDLEPIGGS